ncbi:MAG: cation:dicarboxylase symporter family transporter [Streptosporangiales bacterium]|nr:cation:dicarboxylase symporter family transporter [Streptosporangiales bacterium]
MDGVLAEGLDLTTEHVRTRHRFGRPLATFQGVAAPLLRRLEEQGASRSTVSLVVPLGYSFNLTGAHYFIGVSLIFLANVQGRALTLPTLLLMTGVIVVLAKGVAAVPSGAIVVLLAAAQTLGLPAAAVALLLGIDFLADMGRTAVNVIGNALAAASIAKTEPAPEASDSPSTISTKAT